MTYGMTDFCPGVSLTACAFVVTAAITAAPASARVDARTSIPSQLPVTRAVDGELDGLISETRTASTRPSDLVAVQVGRSVRNTPVSCRRAFVSKGPKPVVRGQLFAAPFVVLIVRCQLSFLGSPWWPMGELLDASHVLAHQQLDWRNREKSAI